MKNLILMLLPTLLSAQYNGRVGINTETPQTTLDVNGQVSLIADVTTVPQYVLVQSSDNQVRKVLISSLTQQSHNCPQFQRNQSSPYYLLFQSNSSVPNPNAPLSISSIGFVSAGSWISQNQYYFSWSNTSGTPLNIQSPFTVVFGSSLTCYY